MPGAFKLEQILPLELILFFPFSVSSLSYWGPISYYPRGLIMGKGITLNTDERVILDAFGAATDV